MALSPTPQYQGSVSASWGQGPSIRPVSWWGGNMVGRGHCKHPPLFCLQKTWVWVPCHHWLSNHWISLCLHLHIWQTEKTVPAPSTSLGEDRMKFWMSEPLKPKSTGSRGVRLRLQRASESPGALVEAQLAGSHPQNFLFNMSGVGPEKIVFLTGF